MIHTADVIPDDDEDECWEHFCSWYQPPSGLNATIFRDIPFPNKQQYLQAMNECRIRLKEKFNDMEFCPMDTLNRQEIADRILFNMGYNPSGYIFLPHEQFCQANLWLYQRDQEGKWIAMPTAPQVCEN